mgnify:CR=1 FL=1
MSYRPNISQLFVGKSPKPQEERKSVQPKPNSSKEKELKEGKSE